MSFLISLLFILIAAIMLARKANAQSVLLLLGILMWTSAYLLNHNGNAANGPENSSDSMWLLDLLSFLKTKFSETLGGLGLMIMVIGGFVKFMDHCGASQRLVDVAIKPLKPFQRNPYLLASLTLPVGQILFMAIPSAAGFALLWMSAVFPILTRLGCSPLTAASVTTATTAFGIGPACATTASAMTVLSLEAVPYFLQEQLPLVCLPAIGMAFVFYFSNRNADRKKEAGQLTDSGAGQPADGQSVSGKENPGVESAVRAGSDSQTSQPHAPLWYAVLPMMPIILLLLFSPWINPWAQGFQTDTTEVMLLSFLITLICEALVRRNLRQLLSDLNVFWKGMSEMLLGVVSLVIAADLFAEGLIALGFIEDLVNSGSSLGLEAGGIGVLLTLIVFGAAVLMGSGNAAFFAFGPLVPGIASGLSCSGTHLLLPMQLSASMGRTISPFSGVLIAVAAPSGTNSVEIAKRNLLPIGSALLLMMFLHFVL
jgi:DcuC family C4-dicarboxylate transporter